MTGNVYPAFNNYDAVVFLPSTYGQDPNKKWPLVISLYGICGKVLSNDHSNFTAGEVNREGFIKQVWEGSTLQSTYGAIVIAPEARPVGGTNQCDAWWNATYNGRLIQDAITYYKVDPNRVVMTGLSSGGGGTDDLMMAYPSLLAGAAVASYTAPGTNSTNVSEVCPTAHINVWVNGNEDDGTFNSSSWTPAYWSNPAVAYSTKIAQCPGYNSTFKATLKPTGGHTGWDTWYGSSELQTWLINQMKH